ncbi:MAG: hypothetical protein HYY45_19920 [Deltaproteobacteria bacterium]|nr:hypothetical protein [Deltaproteobacteria bacterium]
MGGNRWAVTRFWLVGLLLLFPGCAEPDLEAPVLSPLSFEELKQRISRIRGLPFQQEVSLETTSTEAIRATLEKSPCMENEKGNLQQKARVYARLGLLPDATDLPKALLDLRLSHQGAHHDSRRKTILLPSAPWKSGLTFLSPSPTAQEAVKQLLLAQALSHALQEQNFRWEEKITHASTEDLRLALRALRDGDTLLTGLAHLTGDFKENRQKIINGLKGLSRLPAQIDKELFHLPRLLRQKVAFQYLKGSEFISWAYSLKGWEGVNSLFLHPPTSTRQILHPEKYYVKRDDPLRILPWSLIRQFRGKKIMEETLGEFLIYSFLSQTLSEGEAKQAAAGWAGDSLMAFGQGEELVLGWVTAWDDREEAREFYAGSRRALEWRHGASLEPSPGRSDTLTVALQSGSALLLQLRDRFVFLLDGIPLPLSLVIAESLWNDLETGAEPEPLDLAENGLQPFAARR